MEAKNLADLYELPTLDWEPDRGTPRPTTSRRRPTPAARTATPAGSPRSTGTGAPHVTGIGALWVDGAFWFETGASTRKGRNLARDPRCTLSVSAHEFDLVVEGEARPVDDPETVAAMAARWADEGWPARVDDSGRAITAEFSAPSAGPPPWLVYRLTPHVATALSTVEPGGATRWRFDPDGAR